MNTFIYLTTDPLTTTVVVGVIGLIVGSFLNVVIYRLPVMMERDWRAQCAELLKLPADSAADSAAATPFNLSYPGSHCPHCKHPISVLENIPVLSYLWQRGRCTACHHAIALRYPLIELTTALLSAIIAWHFGFGWPLAGALLFTWALLAASMIDFDHQLLPDSITLPFLWLGILCNLFGLYTTLESSVIGAMTGYLSLWSIYWIFKWVTGKEGMGYGDFKLLAMLGAWSGWQGVWSDWQGLLLTVFLSSLVGAVVGVTLILWQGHNKNYPFAFGPYLAMAGWINFLWGTKIMDWYFSWQIPL